MEKEVSNICYNSKESESKHPDSSMKNGMIDKHQKPAIKGKTGGWRAGFFLLVSEGLAALAFTGVEVNMVIFSKLVLRQSNADADKAFSTWIGTLNMCSLFGAFLSDSYLGRYYTCVLFQSLLAIGLVLLSLSTQLLLLEPEGCGKIGNMCHHPSRPKVATFYISIYLLALGSGAIEPALATLGADQFYQENSQENKSKNTFFSYYYIALNLGSLLAETILAYIGNLGKWGLAFWISTSCGFLALAFLLSGTYKYRHIRHYGNNPISRFFQVIVACLRKLKLDVPKNGQGLYEVYGNGEGECVRRISHTNGFKYLDKAAIITPSEKVALCNEGRISNPWRLCTVTQVEEVKCVFKLLPIWFCTIGASMAFMQVLSLFLEQGSSMDTQISKFHIPAASMTVFSVITTSFFIICYKNIIVPIHVRLTKTNLKPPNELKRIGFGMVLSILAMIIAAFVEKQRKKYANGTETSSLTIFWQIPQYVLVGVSEALIYVAEWEFFASKMPDGLKSIGIGLSMASPALGGFLFTIIMHLVSIITSKDGKPGWIARNLNEGHLDRFFFLSGGVIVLDLILFVACANQFEFDVAEERGDVKEMNNV